VTETLTARAFWFLRHGETDWNAHGLSQGNIDIPLNANGIAQAHSAAALLRHRGIATIVSSPLSRARDTAGIVGAALGLPIAIEPDLREVSFGAQEGKPMVAWFAEWVAGRYTPDDAESFAHLRTRAVAAVNRALEHEPPVLIVAHGALFRSLRSAMGLEANVRTQNAVPMFCAPAAGTPAWTLTPVS
jgi:broad specificity phosphatase PhoE